MAASPAGIGGARSCETAAQTREWMEAIAAFLGGHRPLLEAHVVNFFKDRLWETVDAEWMECLRREPVEARVPAISTPPRPTLLALRFRGARHTVCQDPPLCPPNRQWRGSPTRISPSSPSEVEFVAEDEIVEIVPNIRMEALTMICGAAATSTRGYMTTTSTRGCATVTSARSCDIDKGLHGNLPLELLLHEHDE